jgi:DnaA family protein
MTESPPAASLVATPYAQLPLGFGLRDNATFESYLAGANAEAVAYLRRLLGGFREPGLYLWGEPGTGKSHLLQATCHAVSTLGRAAVYLPMAVADQFPSEALNGLENVGMVCIDDVQAIAGRRDWETALMHLLDRIQAAGGGLVTTGTTVPAELGLHLPQLVSRLYGGLVLPLKPLTNDEKLQVLQRRAERRGLHLADEVGRYLLRHYDSQPLGTLCTALETLDRASLAAQRKLTIPFIRSVLKPLAAVQAVAAVVEAGSVGD